MSTLTVQNIQGSSSSSNTINVASGHVLNAAGHVIQTVYSSFSTLESTTSETFVNTSLAASITPSSSSSKILVTVNASMFVNTADRHAVAGIFRGDVSGTSLGSGTYNIGSAYGGNSNGKGYVCCAILDSPSTTSATTYTVGLRRNGASGTVYINVNAERSTIVLQEIAQ